MLGIFIFGYHWKNGDEFHYTVARVAGKKEMTDLAIYECSKSLDHNDTFIRAYELRGTSYLDVGKLPEAIHDFSKAIELNPLNEYAYYWRGVALYKSGAYDEALFDFNKTLELTKEPRYVRLVNYYCTEIWFEKLDFDKALSCLEVLEQFDSTDEWTVKRKRQVLEAKAKK